MREKYDNPPALANAGRKKGIRKAHKANNGEVDGYVNYINGIPVEKSPAIQSKKAKRGSNLLPKIN